MQALLKNLLGLVMRMPALARDVFVRLLGRTTRPHDWFGIFRSTLQMMVTVSSPYKIALTVTALLLVFVSDSSRSIRAISLLAISMVGLIGSLQMLLPPRG
jgi:hypothetical protein